MNSDKSEPNRSEAPLESWKEIAAYLQRNAVTARRWEKEEGLPVHRHAHSSRSSVYAYPSEIDAWRASRRVAAEPPPPLPPWKTLLTAPRAVALGATLTLCLITVGAGIRPQSASAQASGPTARQLWQTASNQQPQGVSPDGRYIAFTDWDSGDLFLRDVAGGKNRRLTNGGGPKSGDYADAAAFSADTSQVAYDWFSGKDARHELRVIPVGGGRPRTLHPGGVSDLLQPFSWTSDGQRILAVRHLPDQTTQIVFVSTEDGTLQTLKSVGWRYTEPSLSPDGRYVAYDSPSETSHNRDIFVVAADGSQAATVVENPADDVLPFWTPDGSHILFTSSRTGNAALWSVAVKDGKPSGPPEILQENQDFANAWLTKDGTLYSYTPGVRANIFSARLNSDMKVSEPPQLAAEHFVNHNNGPAVSPDGSRLAFLSLRETGNVVVIQNLTSGSESEVPTQIPVNMVRSQGPLWFPDGHSLLVLSREPQKAGAGLYRVDISTGRADLVTRLLHQIWGYRLARDGKALFYAEETAEAAPGSHTSRLVRFDLETGRETELKTGELIKGLAVSPDSKQIAYVSSGKEPGESPYIGVMSANGGPGRELYRTESFPDNSAVNSTLGWSPDQNSVIFVNGPDLWRISATGGKAEKMFTSGGTIRSPEVHPDGKRLFFAGFDTSGGGVWTLENFLPAAK